jgi:hypothetical protein
LKQFGGSQIDPTAYDRLDTEGDQTVDSFVRPPVGREHVLKLGRTTLADGHNQKSLGTIKAWRNPFPECGNGDPHGELPFCLSKLQDLRPAVAVIAFSVRNRFV